MFFWFVLHISSVVGIWYLVSLSWSNLTNGSFTENIKTKLSCPRPQRFPKESSACSRVSSSTSHYSQCRIASVLSEQPSLHIQWSSATAESSGSVWVPQKHCAALGDI